MHFKKVKTLKALKKCLKKTLPEKVSQVLESYEAFSERPVPEDAKGFALITAPANQRCSGGNIIEAGQMDGG